MAESPITQTFTGGLNKDTASFLLKQNEYSHALNLIPDTRKGDQGAFSSESATQLCAELPYTLIGSVPLSDTEWMVFTTDDVNSEIGIVDFTTCSYTKFSNTPCLNFNKASLITGASRRNFDCGFSVYWSDGGRNPDRYVNTNTTDPNNDIWVQNCTTPVGGTCTTCVNTDVLDCDKIRIAPIMSIPCLSLAKSTTAGTLLNGTYQVALAYSINGVRVTNYVILSNTISLFSHTNQAGALTCTISGADRVHFKEMILTVISFVNNQLSAKILGTYDTDQETISIDNIDATLVTENTAVIPLQPTIIEKSDSIWPLGDYLLRNGVYEKPDFNYQPLANQISTSWVLSERPEEYYHRSGNGAGMDVGYLRDEVYAFFIRWVYNTGDRSASYHIPGRGYNPAIDAPWRTQNTAGFTSTSSGFMSYWESTEKYPDHQSSIWNSNVPGHPEWDLCGRPIRHHRFPDQTISTAMSHFTSNRTIKILGVKFGNIKVPVDNNGNPITNIVGYEILRGSREGNKSILAKGMINNIRVAESDVPNASPVLYQNYPYNDLNPDIFLTTSQTIGTVGGNIDGWQGNTQDKYKQNYFSFHSPDTTFSNPFLGTGILKTYQTLIGTSTGYFEIPYKHPKFKLITDLVSAFGIAIGAAQVGLDIARAASGSGGANIKLEPTPYLPISTSLGMDTYPDGGSTGALGSAANIAMIALNAAITGLLGFIELKSIQAQVMNIVNGLVPSHQYARQYNSSGFYDNFEISSQFGVVSNYQYIKGYVQTFDGLEVNNLFRNDYVIIKTDRNFTDPLLPIGRKEVSRWSQGQRVTGSCEYCQIIGCPPLNGSGGVTSLPTGVPNLCSYYAAYKINFASQYGQVGSIKQMPITSCIYQIDPTSGTNYTSPTLYGGDTYINRYTEKNPFLFFNDWLVNVPNDFNYDYTQYENLPYPRYWVNNSHIYYEFWSQASKNYHVDENNVAPTDLWVKDGFFYLFYNGVRDFYVESDVNVGFRDWGEELTQRFYDPYGYTDLAYMFRADLIKTDIYYKYDYSLSISKFYSQYLSFGQVLDRQYDPELAYTCYDYYPRRIAYSLPQTEELKADNWRQFLPNNYYDFYSQVTSVKSIGRTGAMFMMKNDSPYKFDGTQVFQQDPSSIAVTIGDGGLFSQPLQSVINVDKGISYGSCSNKYATIGTPNGVFFVSQEDGRVFSYADQYKQSSGSIVALEEISAVGMKYWFAHYLPSRLLQQFPDYPYPDNPVIGVGVYLGYDEIQEILYISKKDYKLKDEYVGKILLSDSTFFYNNYNSETSVPVTLTDSKYFEDCSWTISWDCKNKRWLSFHSWLPSWFISTDTRLRTIKNNKIWTHNNRTDLFANYYDVNYNIEIEYPINTQGITTTLRNVEWYLEAWHYKSNKIDRNQLLDLNWSKAIIFNDEQISGYLNLNRKTNPYTDLRYPVIGPNSIGILYSDKEHHTRINQFWDITKDRNNLTQMWITSENGFQKTINVLYTDYSKPLTQAKKFRAYNNSIFLQKIGDNNIQLNLRLNTAKHQISPR